jgi:hypothetical protein
MMLLQCTQLQGVTKLSRHPAALSLRRPSSLALLQAPYSVQTLTGCKLH